MFDNVRFFHPLSVRKDYAFCVDDHEDLEKSTIDVKESIAKRYRYEDEDFGMAQKENKCKKLLQTVWHKSKKWKSAEVPDYISNSSLMAVMVSLQLNTFDAINFITLILMYGSGNVVFGYAIVSLLISVPLFLVFFFLSVYTKQKYIDLWSSVPVLKGMAVVILIFNLYFIILHIYYSVLNFMMIILTSPPNSAEVICKIPNDGTNHCIDEEPKNISSCNFPVKTYFMHVYHAITSEGVFETNEVSIQSYGTILVSLFMWSLLFLFTMLSTIVFNKYMKLLVMYWLIMLVPIFYEIVISINHQPVTHWNKSPRELTKISFWAEVGMLAVRRVLPGDVINFATHSMPGKNPVTEAVIYNGIRIIMIFGYANRFAVAIDYLMQYYKVPAQSCMLITGQLGVFCYIAEHLRVRHGMYMATLHMMQQAFFNFSIAYISHVSMVETIHKFHSKLLNYKKSLVAAATALCAIFYIPFVLNVGPQFHDFMRQMQLPSMTLLLAVSLFITIYTPNKLLTDFHFYYGYRLPNYWKNDFKLVVMYSFITVFGYVIFCMPHKRITVVEVTLSAIMAVSILIQSWTSYMNYRHKSQKYLMKPEAKWGPPLKRHRDARRRFNPRRECRITNPMVCNHDCLRVSGALVDLDKYWRQRINIYMHAYHISMTAPDSLVAPSWPVHLEPLDRPANWLDMKTWKQRNVHQGK